MGIGRELNSVLCSLERTQEKEKKERMNERKKSKKRKMKHSWQNKDKAISWEWPRTMECRRLCCQYKFRKDRYNLSTSSNSNGGSKRNRVQLWVAHLRSNGTVLSSKIRGGMLLEGGTCPRKTCSKDLEKVNTSARISIFFPFTVWASFSPTAGDLKRGLFSLSELCLDCWKALQEKGGRLQKADSNW